MMIECSEKTEQSSGVARKTREEIGNLGAHVDTGKTLIGGIKVGSATDMFESRSIHEDVC